MKKIRAEQLRAARALLKLSAEGLAELAHIGVATIRRIEGVEGEPSHSPLVDYAIRVALEEAGVILIPENGGGAGVRLAAPTSRTAD